MGRKAWQRYKSKGALGRDGRHALRLLASGLTQSQVARDTGLTPATIHNLVASPAGSRYLAKARARLDAAAREARLALELEREAAEREP